MNVGKLIVVTGPSGVGKGTLVRSLLARHPQLHLSISMTTRSPRPGEVDGQQYYFVSKSEFERQVKAGNLLEWAEFAGNCYGTPRAPIEKSLAQNQSAILEIELEGARQVKINFPQALRIFILPPSLSELERRLYSRASDSTEAIARRLQRAPQEIAAAEEFDIQIINDRLETAVRELEFAIFPHLNIEDPIPHDKV